MASIVQLCHLGHGETEAHRYWEVYPVPPHQCVPELGLPRSLPRDSSLFYLPTLAACVFRNFSWAEELHFSVQSKTLLKFQSCNKLKICEKSSYGSHIVKSHKALFIAFRIRLQITPQDVRQKEQSGLLSQTDLDLNPNSLLCACQVLRQVTQLFQTVFQTVEWG